MAKHIGIVTVSHEGAALCYQTICAEAAAVMGEHRHPEITMHSLPLADYLPFASKGEWKKVADLLLESVNKVAMTGADFAICPANTAHEAFEYLEPRSPIPWLHIVEVVGEAAKARGYAKLGVLGTKFLMEGKVYPSVLSKRNIEVVIPQPQQRMEINGYILGELVKGTLKDSTKDYFRHSVDELAAAGCDAVVMACTEIPLILQPEDVATPLLDSTRLLAQAALKEALS
ncbi:MAG: amino acid racemase [Pyrinomonadaceae bacterium]